MPQSSIVHDAIDDINENLWILQEKARTRITGWFLGIDRAAYDRGYQQGKAQPSSSLTNDQIVLVLQGLKLRRDQLNQDIGGGRHQAIDQIIDLEQEFQTVLSGCPASVG